LHPAAGRLQAADSHEISFAYDGPCTRPLCRGSFTLQTAAPHHSALHATPIFKHALLN
jgi:hypothetical protein